MTKGADLPTALNGWERLLAALNRALSILERAFVSVSALAVLAMMMILVVDVFGRYMFSRPLPWSYDFIRLYLMPMVILLALADTFRRDGHIAVDLFYLRFSPIARRLVRLMASIMIAASLAPIAWLAYFQAVRRFTNNIVISGSILWPTWIPSFLLVLGTSLLILRAIQDAVSLASALARRSETVPGESDGRTESSEKAEGHAI